MQTRRTAVDPWMVLQALKYLCVVQIVLKMRGFEGLHRYVRAAQPPRTRTPSGDMELLRRCFQMGRRLYFTDPKCLALGAACGLFFRRYGWPVDVVLGVARRPFFAHVWVELDGKAIFGTYDKARYVVLDRI